MTQLRLTSQWLSHFVLRPLRREEGGVTVEAVIIMPILAFFYCATFVWFDAFRQKTLVMKASYAVSDVLSRQSQVDEAYLDNMLDVLAYMIPSGETPQMRVSLIEYNTRGNPDDTFYRLRWSHGQNGLPDLTQEMLDRDTSWIPVMGDLDAVVVTETFVPYKPILNVGIKETTYSNTYVTRPRFDLTLLKTDEPVYYSNADDRDDELLDLSEGADDGDTPLSGPNPDTPASEL